MGSTNSKPATPNDLLSPRSVVKTLPNSTESQLKRQYVFHDDPELSSALASSCVQLRFHDCDDLLHKGANPNVLVDSRELQGNWTALTISAENCQQKFVHLLVTRGADPDIPNGEGHTALMLAARNDNAGISEALVRANADVNQVVPPRLKDGGMSALCFAARTGSLQSLNHLLKHKANVDVKSADGSTPLMYAAGEGHAQAVQILLEHKANPDIKDKQGQTALDRARSNRNDEVIAMLEARADSKRPFVRGSQVTNDVLLDAISTRDSSRISLALSRSTSVEILGQDGTVRGWTPLTLASFNNDVDTVRKLLEKGASVDRPNTKGSTPLILSVVQPDITVTEALISAGADINRVAKDNDQHESSPLICAAAHGNLGHVDFLLRCGAKTTVYGEGQTSPLIEAAKGGHRRVITSLTAKGAEINYKDAQGKTAAEWATSCGHQEVARQLGNMEPSIEVAALSKEAVVAIVDSTLSEKLQLKFTHIDTSTILYVMNAERNGRTERWKVVVKVTDMDHCIHVWHLYNKFESHVPDNFRPKVIEYMILVNFSADIGCWDMDLSDGDLRLRESLRYDGVRKQDLPELLCDLVNKTTDSYCQYVVGIDNLINSDSNPKEEFVRARAGAGGANQQLEMLLGLLAVLAQAQGGKANGANGANGASGASGEEQSPKIEVIDDPEAKQKVEDKFGVNAYIKLSDLKCDLDDESTVLGEGGFGKVFRGTYLGLPVAIKRVMGGNASPEEKSTFFKEISIQRNLNHPHLTQVIGVAQAGEEWLLVTELCENKSLHEYLTQVPADDMKTRVRFAYEAAVGLAFLHTNHIIHLDLKSMNLLITKDKHVKIADFGLSRIVSGTHVSKTSIQGTPPYMAPEIITGDRFSFSADVYSFGVILFELFTNELPYKEQRLGPQHLLLKVCQGLRPKIPDSMAPNQRRLIERCWHAKPELRPTFRAILSDLEVMIEEVGMGK